MINTNLVGLSVSVLAVMLILLALYPDVDLLIAALFYQTEGNFAYAQHAFVNLLFDSVPFLTIVFIIGIFLWVVYLVAQRRFKNVLTSGIIFLILSALIGPGLIVNYALKENVGRARPRQIIDFAGSKQFSPPLQISNQCTGNCSFASGHAAMAYYFTVFAYLIPRKYFTKGYLAGLLFGSIIGLSRIVAGGHFLSDVVAAALIVLLVNQLLYLLWQKLLPRMINLYK